MLPTSLANSVTLPGIGTGAIHFDRIRIVSTHPPGTVNWLLPVAQLRNLCHAFKVTTYKGKEPRLRSNIKIVGPQPDALRLLWLHQAALGTYRVTLAEVAIDWAVVPSSQVPATDRAANMMRTIVSHVDKPWHRRGHLRTAYDPYKKPERGHVCELAAIYYEDRRASVALKCYTRHVKLAQNQIGAGLCVRLEWTLKGKRAIDRHLGGNQTIDLRQANLSQFVRSNLRWVSVDYIALGKLFMTPQAKAKSAGNQHSFNDPNYRARRVAYMRLLLLARRRRHDFADEDHALWICRDSPAQIRGYCFEILRQQTAKRQGQPKQYAGHRPWITAHKIRACFQ